MKIFAIVATLLFSITPATFADEDPATCHAIVTDYKTVQSMLKSGQINQRTYQNELLKLQARAKAQIFLENYKSKKERGLLKPGETAADHLNDKYGLEPICGNQEEYLLFDRIFQGFTEEPI